MCDIYSTLRSTCVSSAGRSDCGGQTGGGEWGQHGEHHHEQCCQSADRQQQAEAGGQESGQDPRHPLLQRKDHVVRIHSCSCGLAYSGNVGVCVHRLILCFINNVIY